MIINKASAFLVCILLVSCGGGGGGSSGASNASTASVKAISAGSGHTVALKSDGTVWAWGYNYNGRLGDGTTTAKYTPVQVIGL